MKKQVLFLLSGVLFLAGCSESSDNTPKINVMAKPGNPASQSYFAEIVSSFNESKYYLPEEAAIFDKVISDFDVKNVSGTAEQAEALNKLNSKGRQFVEKIKATCTLANASKSESGTVASGETVVKKATLSASGADCVYELQNSSVQSVYYNEIAVNANTGLSRLQATMATFNHSSRKVRDESIKQISKLSELNVKVDTSMYIDMSETPQGSSGSLNGTINGEVTLKLANGDVIQGPIKGIVAIAANGSSTKTEVLLTYKGTSPKGDIWLGFQAREGKSEVFLNGEKINVESGSGVGQIFGKFVSIQ